MIPFKVYDQINIGPVVIYTWGLMVGLAFIAALLLILWQTKRKKINLEQILTLVIFVFIGAFLGARLFYVLEHLAYFLENPLESLKLWAGGLSFYGGLIGATFLGWLYLKKVRLNFWSVADMVAPALALGIFIGRIGCSLINDHLGSLTNLPWAIKYIDGTIRHPVAEYLSLNGLVLFFFLWLISRKVKKEGFLFIIFLFWYSISRFLLDFTRCYDLPSCDPHFWGLTTSQYFSLGLLILASCLFYKKYIKAPK
ncbi:MAG TPA: prolipoprotein diacylglyceryl transferase [Candidatus Portnoybacteria bacterium]|nr:prolipoprotein diacylglyceryl transferase [Candidatus Portnoybacteria bacterium]